MGFQRNDGRGWPGGPGRRKNVGGWSWAGVCLVDELRHLTGQDDHCDDHPQQDHQED